MTLNLVRIGVEPRALAAFAVARRLSDDDDGYALHAALAARFGSAAPRPFRYLPDHLGGAQLLGYVADAAALEEATALPPVDADIERLFAAPQSRSMPEGWRAGARYGFEVRVRPTIRFGKDVRAARQARGGAWQPKAGEIDAYVAACEKAVAAGDDWRHVDREAVYGDWLIQRLAGAASVEAATVRRFQRARSRRSTHAPPGAGARTRAVEGPDAVIGGTLTIADPDAFARALSTGVGRHAAFGYGMLLLSAPPR